MLKLNAYNMRTKQNLFSILLQFSREGVTDINTILSRLDEELKIEMSKIKVIDDKKIPKIHFEKCPSCKIGKLLPIANNEGLNIIGCKKCRYSKIAEASDVK